MHVEKPKLVELTFASREWAGAFYLIAEGTRGHRGPQRGQAVSGQLGKGLAGLKGPYMVSGARLCGAI